MYNSFIVLTGETLFFFDELQAWGGKCLYQEQELQWNFGYTEAIAFNIFGDIFLIALEHNHGTIQKEHPFAIWHMLEVKPLADSLIPVEVKSNDNATALLNNLLKEDKYPDVKYGYQVGL